jgi:hypothetical protein
MALLSAMVSPAIARSSKPFPLTVWRGCAPKRFYLALWLPILTLLWGGCFVLAWRTYPKYEFANHDISFLGHPALNPKGWWYWSIGMGIASVMLLPPVRYLNRHLESVTLHADQAQPKRVPFSSLCLHLSCLGLMGLALVPQGERWDLVHKASGALAMGGMYGALLALLSVPLFKAGPLGAGRVVLLQVSAWWGVVGFLVTQGYRFFAYGELGHVMKHKDESLLLRFSLWEWMLFVAGTLAFVVCFALVPASGAPEANAVPKKREEPAKAPLSEQS